MELTKGGITGVQLENITGPVLKLGSEESQNYRLAWEWSREATAVGLKLSSVYTQKRRLS